MMELRIAIRSLARDRWFSAAIVLALALGIGATTIVFTIINGWNLQTLPVPEGDRIVHLASRDAQGRGRGVSYPDFLDWRTSLRRLSGVAAQTHSSRSLALEGRPADRVAATFISANGFDVLRLRPILGRDFAAADDRVGADPVVILAHHLWVERFGAAPDVIGRTVRLDGAHATVIGVMPAGFKFPVQTDIWQPIAQRPGIAAEPREVRPLGAFGRLADGVTIDDARADLNAAAAALEAAHPATNQGLKAVMVPFTEVFTGRFTEGPPFILMIAVAVVLIIACANAASLLLCRGAYRLREVAMRRALGASRMRIVRQLLVESLLLASVAGLLGLLLAWPVVRAFAAETADFGLPYWMQLTFDARVFAFIAAACAATTVLFGLTPAWQLSGAHTTELLNASGRAAGVPRARRLTGGLLVVELALSVVLLSSAGLLIRSGLALSAADARVDASNVLTAHLSLPETRYQTPQQLIAFYDRLEERLASMPAVASAAIGTHLPFLGSRAREMVFDDAADPAGRRSVQTLGIGARYHQTLGLAMLRGRPLNLRDGLVGAETAVVNERFVAVHSPDQDPIGRRLRLTTGTGSAAATSSVTIVGVVPSIRHNPTRDPQPAVYLPLRAEPTPGIVLLVRGSGDSTALAERLREEVRRLDPDLPVFNISTLARFAEKSRFTHRGLASMLSLFATFAMLLAALGLYAVTAYAVSRRRSEIGIRMALGAQPSQISWLFLKETLARLGLGLTVGIAGAIGVGQLLRGLLVRTSPLDPGTFTVVAALLAAVAMLSSFAPVRRAAALDPAVTLRHD